MGYGISDAIKCRICNNNSKYVFTETLLNKYKVKYFCCNNCGFLQTEEPYWLEESYKESINRTDTGILARNIYLSKIIALFIYFFFDKDSKFLDYAGGYGIFTRLMRDIGLDFYWTDIYSKNLVARGFEFNDKHIYELVTSIEVFEHLTQPIEEIENILKISQNIIFTTELLPNDNIPNPNDWWYYGLEHGQHISFYSKKTLEFIAKKYELNLYSNNSNFHILTKKKLKNNLFKLIFKLNKMKFGIIIRRKMKSKTMEDMNYLIKKIY